MVAVSLLIVIVLWWAIVLHLLRMAIVTSDALVTVVTTASHWCASFKTSTSSWLWVVSVIVVAWSTHVATLVISAPAAALVVVSLLAIVLLFKSLILVQIRVKSSSPAHFAVSPKFTTTSHFAASSHLAVASEAHGWSDFKLFELIVMCPRMILLL